MKSTGLKIAASTAIVAMTMIAGAAQSEAQRRLGPATKADSPSDRDAARYYEQGRRALQQGQLAQAQTALEEAVARSPRDAGYRLLLADIYMKSGRFESARDTFADVIELDPSNTRAGLSLALMQIALGRPAAAVAQLDELQGRAAPADLGLAYALAGLPQRAIEILEPAARGFDATPRLRQNLALSYALAGDWQRARIIASQDVSPADLPARLQQWAALARPDGGSNQVATLLGVSPVGDPGQPQRLALRAPQPEPAPVAQEAFAEAAPVAVEPVEFAQAAPVQPVDSDWGRPADTETAAEPPVEVAEAPSYYLPPTPPPAPSAEQSEEAVRYAAAARTLTEAPPAVVRTTVAATPPAPVFRRAAPRATPAVRRGESRFVVQLGSFAIEGNAERAWVQAETRFGLAQYQPLTTTFQHQGRTLHRVSIAGFASHTDAQRLCGAIRSQGGACFVRTSAGDAAVRWAARYGPERNRRA